MERREKDDDEKFWKPEFWALVAQDLRETEWPSTKKVWQTFLISQVIRRVIFHGLLLRAAQLYCTLWCLVSLGSHCSQVAFIFVIIMTLLFDAFCDATIRSILLGDEWTFTMDRVLKVAQQAGPM
eukprot:scaffold251917_cov29-Tisochrysis_lutea.AAC.2